jgi:subtilase family serine protease
MSRQLSRYWHSRRPIRRRARIHVEQLEARNLMSFTPKQLVQAYGFNQLSQTGSGQTIALIDAYYDPTIQSDLASFSTTYGLAQLDGLNGDGTFTQVDLTGNKTQSPPGDDWTLETALDVEWAHAIAPKANILLVEANSDLTDPFTGEPTDLLNAVTTATNMGAHVVSMSWGISEVPDETIWDNQFFNAPNVTYLAASGDSGAGTIWPAVSPNVVAVGGTTLKLNSLNNISSETGWGNGIFSFFFGGSGGGFSTYETLPTYQQNISTVSNGFKLTDFGARLNPDVAYDANPSTGFNVIDAADGGSFVVGGTSAGAPQWGALIALADQGRSTPLSSSQTLNAIYSSSNASGFHDITTGASTGAYEVVDNFGNFLGTITVAPQVGYDMVTGQGSPNANVLVPNLIKGVGFSSVKTAAALPAHSSGTSAAGNSGKGGAKDMPPSSSANPGTNATNNLTTQGLVAVSLIASNTAVPPIVSFFTAAPATVPAPQPVLAVQATSTAASASSLSRNFAFTGGSDSSDDKLLPADPSKVRPADYQEDKGPAVKPDGGDASFDRAPMSPSNVDGYFIEATGTDELPVIAPVMVPSAKDQTDSSVEPAAGMIGLVALLGGCWTVQDSREDKKKGHLRRYAS